VIWEEFPIRVLKCLLCRKHVDQGRSQQPFILNGLKAGGNLKFGTIIDFLNRIKHMDILGDRDEDLSNQEKAYIESIKGQNPYGITGMFMGGLPLLSDLNMALSLLLLLSFVL
jgi:hypothetical protein